MSIVIPSSNIYDITNKKVLDNSVKSVSIVENIYNSLDTEFIRKDILRVIDTTKTFNGDWTLTDIAETYTRYEFEVEYCVNHFNVSSTSPILYNTLSASFDIATEGNTTDIVETVNVLYGDKDYTVDYIPTSFPSKLPEVANVCNELIRSKPRWSYIQYDDFVFRVSFYYINNIKVYIGTRKDYLGQQQSYTRQETSVNPTLSTKTFVINGEYSSSKTKSRTIGSNGLEISLSGNELLQDKTIYNGVPIATYLAENIITEYENGKETAVLKCNIGDYYDTNDNLTISTNTVVPKYQYETITTEVAPSYFAHSLRFTIDKPYTNDINIRCTVSYSNVATPILVAIPSGTTTVSINVYSGANSVPGITVSDVLIDNGTLPMTFKIGDIVIPYVFGVGGQDKPMSRYKDGSPKQFRVVGAKIFFSGATWQEITLQEILV